MTDTANELAQADAAINLATELERLSAAATPGEWCTHSALRGFKGDIFVPTAKQVKDCHHIARLFADKPKKTPMDELQVRVESNEAIRQIEANATLIVALRNNLPAIIAALKAAETPLPGAVAGLLERIGARTDRLRKQIASCQLIWDLLAPEMAKLDARTGHDTYTVRMAVDHKSSIRTETKELADWTEAASLIEAQARQLAEREAEIARLREANGILEDALQEAGDDYPGSSMQEWCQQQVKAARRALENGHG